MITIPSPTGNRVRTPAEAAEYAAAFNPSGGAEEQFGGERVLGPDEEQTLEAFRGGLDELENELEMLLGPLPEPIRDEGFAAQVEQAVEGEMRR